MAYPYDKVRFGFLLQRAIKRVKDAAEIYDYHYLQRRDDKGNYIKGPSFTAVLEKNAYSRLLRAKTELRNMESFWNSLYESWHSFQLRFDELETKSEKIEQGIDRTTQIMEEAQIKLAIAPNENARAVLVTQFARACTEQAELLRSREYIRGRIKKLINKKPLQVISLEEIKSGFAGVPATTLVNSGSVKDVPISLKALQDAIIRRNKADHVRIEPTAPDVMNIMDIFFDSPEAPAKPEEEK